MASPHQKSISIDPPESTHAPSRPPNIISTFSKDESYDTATASSSPDLLTQLENDAIAPKPSPFHHFFKTSIHSQRFLCGIASGTITALLFNPWDRALYLSVISQRSFFSAENWRNPFVGSSQSMVIRTISGSMFFPLKEWFDEQLMTFAHTHELRRNPVWISFFSGILAGAVNGVALNSINAVKYHTWSTKKGFFGTIAYMYKNGGVTPFLRGQSATVVRDTMFGGVYAFVKHIGENTLKQYQRKYYKPIEEDGVEDPRENMDLKPHDRFIMKLVDPHKESAAKFSIAFAAATAGTVLSAPLNYTRNHMFGTKPGQRIPTSGEILRDLWRDAQAQGDMNKLRYISMRFRLGAATTRVACGMAVGQGIYDFGVRKMTVWMHEQDRLEEQA